VSSPRLLVSPDFLQSVNVNILPRDDATYDLGSSSYKWKNGYFGGNLNIGNISLYERWDNVLYSDKYFVRIHELAFVDVALGRNVSVSGGTIVGNGPTSPIVPSNYWEVTTTDGFPQEMTIDFGTTIYGIYVISFGSHWYSDSNFIPKDYEIQKSTDGSTWTTLVSVTGNTDAPVVHHFTSASARYIKLIVKSPQDGKTETHVAAFRVLAASSSKLPIGFFDSLKIGGTEVIDASRILKNIASIAQNLLPDADNTRDLGSSSFRWKDGWFSGQVRVGDALIKTESALQEGLDAVLRTVQGGVWAEVRAMDGSSTNRPGMAVRTSLNGGVDWIEVARIRDDWAKFAGSLLPYTDNSIDLGSSSLRWKNGYFAGLLDIGSLQIGGTEIIDNSRILKNLASIAQALLPNADNSYDLGSSTFRWRYGYFADKVISGRDFSIKDGIIMDTQFGTEETTGLLAWLSLVQNDYFLFNPPDKYEYDDGSGFVEGTIGDSLKGIFIGKIGTFVIPNGRNAVRFTWSDITSNRYFRLFYMIVSGNTPIAKITFEGSSDGSSWTKIGEWSAKFSGNPKLILIWKYIRTATYGRYFRITIEPDWTTGGNLSIRRMGMLFSVSLVREDYLLRKLFNWDFDKVISFYNTIQPNTDNSYNLGSSSLRWKNGYFAGDIYIAGNKVWHAGNDGAGSGLDADLLDGKQSGNSSGQIPVSNGTKCTNLNADMVDGEHASAFTHARNGGKNIWVQSSTPTAQAVGDIWIQTS